MLRVLGSLAFIATGLLAIVKSYKIIQIVGHNSWAERKLGGGGSYLLVQGIGVVFILIGIAWILGYLNF